MELEIRRPKLDTTGVTINLYKHPLAGDLNLEECQDLFRQRLECLHIFEKNSQFYKNDDQFDVVSKALSDIKSYVFKTNCIKLQKTKIQDNVHKLDHHSHMLARLYCIYNPVYWAWFKTGEKQLMYYRLKRDLAPTGQQLEEILRSFDFEFELVPIEDISQLRRENIIGWKSRDREHQEVFKVHFLNAIKFLPKRKVALKAGYAYITRSEIISVVCDVFEKHLDKEFRFGTQHLDIQNLQVSYLLDSLKIVYSDFEDRVNDEKRKSRRNTDGEAYNPYKIEVDDIEDVCKAHFPPCMRYLQESLTQDHHLKHSGRLMYGTFLRSGGVEMETAIEFWRKEFTKKIPNDKFDRDYKYNIRHLYGQEGHKKALSCFSCDKIINDNPGLSDKHGCPFKHFDDTTVKNMMVKDGLKDGDIEAVMTFRNDKDYKLACSHYFNYMKGFLPEEPIKSPIQYYYESKRLANRKEIPMIEEGVQEKIESGDIEIRAIKKYADEDDEMTDDF